jgi:phosphatidate cytidylyltransferase
MKSMNTELKRWITGVIAVPILFAVIAYGSAALFTLLIVAASLLGMGEYNRMLFAKGPGREKIETLVASLVILLAAASGNPVLMVSVITFSLMAAMILNLLAGEKGSGDMIPAAWVVLGVLYIPLLMSHFILIRQGAEGRLWIFFILVVAFSGDTAAYYVGRKLGKRKLLPHVSPGKTVEGTIGLILGGIAGALVFRQLFFPMLPWIHAVLLGFLGSIVGQLGDLSESALKRAAGVKDSGVLLPGHGGILDRLDCLMFITPLVYYYQALVIR